jgi:hypothetical protein
MKVRRHQVTTPSQKTAKDAKIAKPRQGIFVFLGEALGPWRAWRLVRGQRAASRAQRLLAFAASLSAFALAACAGPQRSSKTEDEARALVPVPICLERLPRRTTPNSIVSLSSEEYWQLLLPGFDRSSSTLDLARPDCSGRASLASLVAGGGKVQVRPDSLVLSSGADGLKVVWLPVEPTGQVARGLLALARQRENFLEVYALGLHVGNASGTRFTVERMGPALSVAALEERCQGTADDKRCNATCTVYLMATGRLAARAKFPVDRVARAREGAGQEDTEYRFSASAEYRADAVVLSERLAVTAKGRGAIRSTDLQRTLRLDGGKLVPSVESLWAQTAKQLGLSEEP